MRDTNKIRTKLALKNTKHLIRKSQFQCHTAKQQITHKKEKKLAKQRKTKVKNQKREKKQKKTKQLN